jgi:hypothetical protein
MDLGLFLEIPIDEEAPRIYDMSDESGFKLAFDVCVDIKISVISSYGPTMVPAGTRMIKTLPGTAKLSATFVKPS